MLTKSNATPSHRLKQAPIFFYALLGLLVAACQPATPPSAPTPSSVPATPTLPATATELPPATSTLPPTATELPPAPTDPATPAYRATPVAETPAAGVCASFEGDRVEVGIEVDTPNPRCVKATAAQRLTLINRTSVAVDVMLGLFTARIEPGQAYTIDQAFGDYLLPGVHFVLASPYSGPEVWLTDDTPQ